MDLTTKQYFIFDLDDTLINTHHANEAGLKWAYEKLASQYSGKLSSILPYEEFHKDLKKIYRSTTKKGRRKYFDYTAKVFEEYCTKTLHNKPKIFANWGRFAHIDHSLAARLYWQFREMKYAAFMTKPYAEKILLIANPISF